MLITEHLLGRHTKYSRYSSMSPKGSLPPFTYTYEPDDFPVRDESLFRIVTINGYRFPHAAQSQSIFECLLLAALPDIVLLQEMKAFPILRQVLATVNKTSGDFQYSYFSGKEYNSGLNVATVYNNDILHFCIKQELLSGFDVSQLYSLRRPFQFTGFYLSRRLDIVNVHAVSRGARDADAIRTACLSAFSDYLAGSGIDDQMIIGGDFNMDSDSYLLPIAFPNFHYYISDYEDSCNHFLVSKDLISSDDIDDVKQYKLPIETYLQLTEANYNIYMSDHFPVVLDIPKSLL